MPTQQQLNTGDTARRDAVRRAYARGGDCRNQSQNPSLIAAKKDFLVWRLVRVRYAAGKNNYPLKAGQGMKDPTKALYSVGPGKYPLTIKIPGERPRTVELDIAVGATWSVFALPTGGYIANQLD